MRWLAGGPRQIRLTNASRDDVARRRPGVSHRDDRAARPVPPDCLTVVRVGGARGSDGHAG